MAKEIGARLATIDRVQTASKALNAFIALRLQTNTGNSGEIATYIVSMSFDGILPKSAEKLSVMLSFSGFFDLDMAYLTERTWIVSSMEEIRLISRDAAKYTQTNR